VEQRKNIMTYKVLSSKVEVLEPNEEGFIAIQVRENRLPLDENGNPNGASYYHRDVHMPDHDCCDDHPTVAAICAAIHTQEWKDKYQAKLDAEAAKAEAERLEAERIAVEAEAEAQRLADEVAAARQAEIDAAVAKALEAQQAS
jgi:hypothetical protein